MDGVSMLKRNPTASLQRKARMHQALRMVQQMMTHRPQPLPRMLQHQLAELFLKAYTRGSLKMLPRVRPHSLVPFSQKFSGNTPSLYERGVLISFGFLDSFDGGFDDFRELLGFGF